MSREIKFRAWDKKRKCWICFEDYFESLVSECTNIMILSNNVEWIQFTGLHDRNGKEIWEGDIVETQAYSTRPYSANRKEKRFIGKVFYRIDSGIFGDGKRKEYDAGWHVETQDRSEYRYGSWGDFYDCVVIGNIYEHPELLQEQAP